MKGGQNKAPAALKALRGTTRKDRTNRRAPLVSPKIVPKPPYGLKPIEKRVWRELAPQVEHLGVFTKSDLTAFRLLVQVVAKTRGKAFDLESGTAQVRMLQVASSLIQSFGLNPASRERVAVQPPAAPLDAPSGETAAAPEQTPLFGLRVVPKVAAGA